MTKLLASNDKGGLVFRSAVLAMALRGIELPEDEEQWPGEVTLRAIAEKNTEVGSVAQQVKYLS